MTDNSNPGERQRASRQELLKELQRLAEDLGRTPTFQDMDEHGKYSGALYAVRFDSWNAALKQADLEPNPRQQFSDAELLEELRTFAKDLEKTPSSKNMNKHGPHNSKTYKDRFGSWNNALEEAGLDINRAGATAIPEPERKQKLLDDLQELAEDLGRVPTQKEVRKFTDHSHNTYYDHWDGIKQALEASDANLDELDTTRTTRPRSIETEDLLKDLQRLAELVERPPRWVDIREHGKYSDSPYRSRFDSLEDAHREAGISTGY